MPASVSSITTVRNNELERANVPLGTNQNAAVTAAQCKVWKRALYNCLQSL